MKRATSSYSVDQRQTSPLEWPGGQMARNRFSKTFKGDLIGRSVVESTMLGMANGLTMYIAIERFECSLAGHVGTFLLFHQATAQGEAQTGVWTIVTGSGTGELVGITGRGQIQPNHVFALDYDLSR